MLLFVDVVCEYSRELIFNVLLSFRVPPLPPHNIFSRKCKLDLNLHPIAQRDTRL